MTTEWYYAVDGTQHGPISVAELRQLANDGRLRSDHLVWKEGLADWIEARKIKGLFPTDAPTSPISRLPPPPTPMADRLSPHNGNGQKACPCCGEQILAVAQKCRFCGEWLDKSQRRKAAAVPIKVVATWNIPFYILFTLQIYWVFWLYRIFKELHSRELTPVSPGTAVGCLFIPIYNFYWLFVVFSKLQRGIERAYRTHRQPIPSTGWIWVMPIVWLPGIILNLATAGAGIPLTMIGASLTLCFVQSWMNNLASIEDT